MSSAAEQLAANFNWSTFSKADDLKKRLWFTLAALLVFRLGAYLPLPGIDAELMSAITQRNSGGVLGLLDKFSGGALGNMAIFALGVMPYISASIIVQLMTAVVPHDEVVPGVAIGIVTGAMLPRGADAVVMIEDTHCEGEQVLVGRAVTPGHGVAFAGTDISAQETVLWRDERLHPADRTPSR